jgi:hypothetical protein
VDCGEKYEKTTIKSHENVCAAEQTKGIKRERTGKENAKTKI